MSSCSSRESPVSLSWRSRPTVTSKPKDIAEFQCWTARGRQAVDALRTENGRRTQSLARPKRKSQSIGPRTRSVLEKMCGTRHSGGYSIRIGSGEIQFQPYIWCEDPNWPKNTGSELAKETACVRPGAPMFAPMRLIGDNSPNKFLASRAPKAQSIGPRTNRLTACKRDRLTVQETGTRRCVSAITAYSIDVDTAGCAC